MLNPAFDHGIAAPATHRAAKRKSGREAVRDTLARILAASTLVPQRSPG